MEVLASIRDCQGVKEKQLRHADTETYTHQSTAPSNMTRGSGLHHGEQTNSRKPDLSKTAIAQLQESISQMRQFKNEIELKVRGW